MNTLKQSIHLEVFKIMRGLSIEERAIAVAQYIIETEDGLLWLKSKPCARVYL